MHKTELFEFSSFSLFIFNYTPEKPEPLPRIGLLNNNHGEQIQQAEQNVFQQLPYFNNLHQLPNLPPEFLANLPAEEGLTNFDLNHLGSNPLPLNNLEYYNLNPNSNAATVQNNLATAQQVAAQVSALTNLQNQGNNLATNLALSEVLNSTETTSHPDILAQNTPGSSSGTGIKGYGNVNINVTNNHYAQIFGQDQNQQPLVSHATTSNSSMIHPTVI